jgi:nicotinamide-nucleotide amidase
MPTAEIITIGTELLLGDLIDTNSKYIAQTFRDAGIDLYRITTIGDNAGRIAQCIREATKRCDIIITTGGLGPTIDDPTRQAVADAMDVKLFFHPELWEQIRERFTRYGRQANDNNKRQAYLPEGAEAIENPVGTAPSFIFDNNKNVIISLPGVPREMEHLMQKSILPYLRKRYDLHGIIKTRVIHTVSAGESQVDEIVGDLETASNPTVGLLAHPGLVDIRITAKSDSLSEAEKMIQQVECIVRQRLGDFIFGADDDKLEDVVNRLLRESGWSYSVIEAGLNGALVQSLSSTENSFISGEISSITQTEELVELVNRSRNDKKSDVVLGALLIPDANRQNLSAILITPRGEYSLNRSYGGPPEYSQKWGVNLCLDLIRRSILKRSE